MLCTKQKKDEAVPFKWEFVRHHESTLVLCYSGLGSIPAFQNEDNELSGAKVVNETQQDLDKHWK